MGLEWREEGVGEVQQQEEEEEQQEEEEEQEEQEEEARMGRGWISRSKYGESGRSMSRVVLVVRRREEANGHGVTYQALVMKLCTAAAVNLCVTPWA